jgi:hypothetical protein
MKKSGVFQLESIERLGLGKPALLRIFFPIRTFIQTINIVIITASAGNIWVKASVMLFWLSLMKSISSLAKGNWL